MEKFACRTGIYAGTGTVSVLKTLNAKRLLVVADPFFAKNGWVQRIISMAGVEQWEVFDRVQPDPSVELAAEGTACVNRFQPDLIVALGGGSTMDCAKAMRFFSDGKPCLVAVPTTSGSGSEVTDFAILSHGQVKHPLVDDRIRPELAILDSQLLTELPPGVIADGGFDALTHAMEAWVATGASQITDALAQDAFCEVYRNLAASFTGQQEVRLNIHMGATMAGMAFSQSGLGLCHAMAHSLGGMFHIPHGRLNAILLPAVMTCNETVAGRKYGELARLAGFPGTADTIAIRNLKNGLIRLRSELKLPGTLAQAGISPREVQRHAEQLVAATLADPCCQTNPGKPDAGWVCRILDEVVGHG